MTILEKLQQEQQLKRTWFQPSMIIRQNLSTRRTDVEVEKKSVCGLRTQITPSCYPIDQTAPTEEIVKIREVWEKTVDGNRSSRRKREDKNFAVLEVIKTFVAN